MDVFKQKYHGGRPNYEIRTASRECFKEFKKLNPTIKITYKQYENCIRGINREYSKYIVETGIPVPLPQLNGTLVILKKPIVRYRDGRAGPINWKATDAANALLKEGEPKVRIFHLNFHTDGYICEWFWVRNRYTNHGDLWKFKPCKINQNLLTERIRTKPDQYQYYKQFEKWRIL